jgi:D-alanyl-D-alanine carboxypeptidase/D-alanyl-D-alanine-endopeptidase (penicillin-binding protein 4)
VAIRVVFLALIVAAAGCGGARAPAAAAPAAPSTSALRQLQREIESVLDAPELRRSTWGLRVRSLARNDILVDHFADRLLLPASNTKIITIAAAAERLGWDFSFPTELATLGPIDGGILYGDLVVVGSGDPTIDDWDGRATSLFKSWADALRSRGISTITGGVIGDDNRIADTSLGAGWAWDDLDRSYAASVGALQFNQNTVRLTIAPGAAAGDPAILTIAPFGSGLTVRNAVKTGAPGAAPFVETRRGVGSATLDVRGTIAVGGTRLVRNVSVQNPTLYFLSALREALVARGIEIRGAAIDVDDLPDPSILERRTALLTHHSPTLAELSITTMKLSQNLFAETILEAAGGLEAVRATLAGWNVESGTVFVADGSGLSRYNLVTPDTLVAILAHVHRDERLRDRFEATLPVAGRDGTLADRMIGTPAEGNARAKTGSFSNARGLAGYVQTADGEPLAFAILANNFGTTPDTIERAADAIVVKLAEFRRRR